MKVIKFSIKLSFDEKSRMVNERNSVLALIERRTFQSEW